MPQIAAPDRYRWVVVFAAAVILALSMGQMVNGLSVFFVPLEAEFGWARGDVALINTAGVVGLAVGGIAMGQLAPRVGTRAISVFGAVVMGLCVTAASQAQALWQLYALFLVGGALGAAAFFAPLIALVGNWFAAGAGMALGIASAGQALGQGTVPLVSAMMIESFGWRGAFLGLGLATLAVCVPLSLLMREPPVPAGGAGAGGADEAPTPLPPRLATVLLSLAVVGCCTLMSVPLMHLAPLMQGCGLAATDAGGVMVTMLVSGIAGRLFFGRLSDMVGALPAFVTASLWQTLMVFGFTRFATLEGFYIYAVIYGFGYAGVMTGVLTTARALSPAAKRASTTGIVVAFAWLGHGLGGWQAGALYDLTGAYTAGFAVATAAGVMNLAILTGMMVYIRRGPDPAPA
ncbi:MFS transporter [Albimonas sp. CAU 1670]|uniref:MFS transporter n=1 Tax=Albimonas sp. CAU 1670 TaxID=3032599 RepID=UPI0023DC1DF4|nr:MFS transporter [Albimonas sp. CAU 1670]MDF2232655.1 MFS transporter [Albimonas sp. CAU 1670]